ncbi:MAG: hypothetical protein ABEJ05_10205 [Haloglomus sp.]
MTDDDIERVPLADLRPSRLLVSAAKLRDILGWFDADDPAPEPLPTLELDGRRYRGAATPGRWRPTWSAPKRSTFARTPTARTCRSRSTASVSAGVRTPTSSASRTW